MNPLDDFGIQVLPGEQIVVSREDYPSRDGEVAGITSARLIAIGTAWPGPSLFGYTVPIETCRMIQYQRHSHLVSILFGYLMILAGIGGFVCCLLMHCSWFVFLAFTLLFLAGVPRLFRLHSTEICFHCEKEVLKWSFHSGKDTKHIVSKIRTFAEGRGIAISNFPT